MNNLLKQKNMNRISFLKKSLASVFGLTSISSFASKINFKSSYNDKLIKLTLEEVLQQKALFTLPALQYATDALEPHFDKLTMEIHHGKHHKAYVDNLIKAVTGTPNETLTLGEMLSKAGKMPIAVRNNGGGHWNHSFFWQCLSPANGLKPQGKLVEAIDKTFGSFDKFKEEFTKAAASRFGSGWAWLIIKDKKLVICSTPNQDNPMMDVAEVKGNPILGLDVWEHAYYLKYQNKRADYVNAYWNLVNWNKVSDMYDALTKA
jgi:superoxide dismutase, Fe-Mn family